MVDSEIKNIDLNKNVSKYVNNTLKQLFVSLKKQYKDLCITEVTRTDIEDALNNQTTDIIGSLTVLAKITTRLAIPKLDEQISESEYSYQGKEKLYDILDSIRHEFRMLNLNLKDKGIDVDAREATNNLVFAHI